MKMLIVMGLYAHLVHYWYSLSGPSISMTSLSGAVGGTGLTYTLDKWSDTGDYSSSGNLARYAEVLVFLFMYMYSASQQPGIILSTVASILLTSVYDNDWMGFSIKGLFRGSKTLFVPAVHIFWTSSIFGRLHDTTVLSLFVLRLIILNIAMDVKDIDTDLRRGVKTIPNLIGREASFTLIALLYSIVCMFSVYLNIVSLAISSASLAALVAIHPRDTAPNVVMYADSASLLAGRVLHGLLV